MATNKVEVDGFTIEEIPTETPLYDVMNGNCDVTSEKFFSLTVLCCSRGIPMGDRGS